MAIEGILQSLPGVSASADLSAKQFYIVKMSGDKTVTFCAGVTDKCIGVLQDAPTSGQPANVAIGGLSKVLAGGTVAYGDLVGTDGNGKAVAIVAGTDTTQYVLGRCVLGGASGEYISVLLTPGGRAA
jgi:hypothetical protein